MEERKEDERMGISGPFEGTMSDEDVRAQQASQLLTARPGTMHRRLFVGGGAVFVSGVLARPLLDTAGRLIGDAINPRAFPPSSSHSAEYGEVKGESVIPGSAKRRLFLISGKAGDLARFMRRSTDGWQPGVEDHRACVTALLLSSALPERGATIKEIGPLANFAPEIRDGVAPQDGLPVPVADNQYVIFGQLFDLSRAPQSRVLSSIPLISVAGMGQWVPLGAGASAVPGGAIDVVKSARPERDGSQAASSSNDSLAPPPIGIGGGVSS